MDQTKDIRGIVDCLPAIVVPDCRRFNSRTKSDVAGQMAELPHNLARNVTRFNVAFAPLFQQNSAALVDMDLYREETWSRSRA